MFFNGTFRKMVKLLSAAIASAVITAASTATAYAIDTWQSADKVGNYVKNAPHGKIVGSIGVILKK